MLRQGLRLWAHPQRNVTENREAYETLRIVKSVRIDDGRGAGLATRVIPAPTTDLALMCAIWITFYPVARLKRSEPRWAHWARGIRDPVAFLLAQRFFR